MWEQDRHHELLKSQPGRLIMAIDGRLKVAVEIQQHDEKIRLHAALFSFADEVIISGAKLDVNLDEPTYCRAGQLAFGMQNGQDERHKQQKFFWVEIGDKVWLYAVQIQRKDWVTFRKLWLFPGKRTRSTRLSKLTLLSGKKVYYPNIARLWANDE